MSTPLVPGKAPKPQRGWSATRIGWLLCGALLLALLALQVLNPSEPSACDKAQDAKVHADDPTFADHDAAVLEYAVQKNLCDQGQ